MLVSNNVHPSNAPGYFRRDSASSFEQTSAVHDQRVREISRNTVLFWQDEHQPYAIEVVEGAIRAVRLWDDGTRQILAFFWPGDVIRPADLQRYTAEAVTRCVLRSRQDVKSAEASGTDQALQASIRLLAATGKKSAISRMAWFLLQVHQHLPDDGTYRNALRFTIPRNDVADYLGMTLETVCRTLATFRARGIIDLPTRKTIRFCNIPQLTLIANSSGCG
jgi:CRP-like cAMP-binding protein